MSVMDRNDHQSIIRLSVIHLRATNNSFTPRVEKRRKSREDQTPAVPVAQNNDCGQN